MNNPIIKCSHCEEYGNIMCINDVCYCSDCIQSLFSWCNKDEMYRKENEVFSCSHDQLTYHKDYIKVASDGCSVFEDNLESYEEIIDLDNWPEYD